MSYLDAPRIHFIGRFFANPSTINNDLGNYALKPPLDLSWNPNGSAFFYFQDCEVSSVVSAKGNVTAADADDPILGAKISTPALSFSPQTSVAKIVDLDPDQQTVTQLYGVVVTIALSGGRGSVVGRMAIAELRDLWFGRVGSLGGDEGASGLWQSTLTDLSWTGYERSPFLRELYDASPDTLSIKFNTDAYDGTPSSPTFNQGRLAGTIGPSIANEPAQLVMGRRLVPVNPAYAPAPFTVSRGGDRLVFDLGNSMPLKTPGGEVSGESTLDAVILDGQGNIVSVLPSSIDASRSAYAKNSGVCEVPLTPDQASLVATSPIGLVAKNGTELLLSEPLDGRYVNVEPASLRLNPGQSGSVALYATQFGAPLSGLQLAIKFDQPGGVDEPNVPTTGIEYPATVTTLPTGRVLIPIAAHSPSPLPERRTPIGSQVYFLGGDWENWGQITLEAPVSVLIFDDTPEVANPTWADVQPVLNQYAVLYPAMRSRIDLSQYESVKANASVILEALSLSVLDPAFMPVTRDLSASHLTLLKTWFKAGAPQ